MDLFLPILLAEGAALELSWGAIIGTIVTSLLGSGGGIKLLWNYWVKREAEKRANWQKVVDDKDEIIAKKDEDLEKLRKEKDDEIQRLSIKLSEKSDEHAAKIQELMGMALEKVESMGTKVEGILDRSLTVQAEFTSEVRKLNLEPGSDIGGH